MKKKSIKQKKQSIAIELKNVNKKYIIHHEKPTFVENVIKNGHKEEFTALDKIDLTIYQGEKVGIIGPNGAGKTTLLKIIAGITTPDKGVVKTRGRIVSLIDLEAGFHPDLTGEENIFLNGLVIGMSKKEINKQFKKIIKFADIGKFIDAPLYTYSAGMQLRLGFAVAVHSDPDVLLIDEGFAVGDENFREKVHRRINGFKKQKKTLIMVSHWLTELNRNCNKILWLEKGEIVKFGGKKIMELYNPLFKVK